MRDLSKASFYVLSSQPWRADFWGASKELFSPVDTFTIDPFLPKSPSSFLFDDGCKEVDSTHFDCYEICNDHVFDNLSTLHNCAEMSTTRAGIHDTQPLSFPLYEANHQKRTQRVVAPNNFEEANVTAH